MMRFLAIVVLLCAAACGPAVPRGDKADPLASHGPAAIKMRHQIMVSYSDEVQVFEGYMIQRGDSFIVQAYAGPGIDLFTVARKGELHREEAHVKALEGRLDLAAVGEDIARVYFPGCPPSPGGTVECEMLGEHLLEEYREDGALLKRTFPEAHGIGVTVTMSGYDLRGGRQRPDKIVIEWGSGKNRMVIKLLTVEPFDGDLDALLKL